MSGSFFFDDLAKQAFDWNIGVNDGNLAGFPQHFYVAPGGDYYYNGFGGVDSLSFYGVVSQGKFGPVADSRLLNLSFAANLTGTGGTIPLILNNANGNFSGECYACNPFRTIVLGFGTTIVPEVAAAPTRGTPEPGGVVLLLTGGCWWFGGGRACGVDLVPSGIKLLRQVAVGQVSGRL